MIHKSKEDYYVLSIDENVRCTLREAKDMIDEFRECLSELVEKEEEILELEII